MKRAASLLVVFLGVGLPGWTQATPDPCRNREVFVTVSDGNFKTLSHLTAENFRGAIGEKRAEIVSVNENALPRRVAFLIDASGSMADRYSVALQMAEAFLPYVGHQTHFAVYLFGDTLYRLLDFEDPPELLFQKQLPPAFRYGQGRTALFDSIAVLVRSLDHPGPEDVVVVFTDAGDNHSRITATRLRPLIIESGVRVYGIFTPTFVGMTQEETAGPDNFFNEVVEPSGGQWLVITSPKKKPNWLKEEASMIMGQMEIPYRIEIKLPQRLEKDSKLKMELQGLDRKLEKKFHLIYPRELARCQETP